MKQKPNLIVIVADTLRSASMGCYGNKQVHTPNFDAFANKCAVFDSAYPESLPTIQARRALHTGRRAYPFDNYKPVKWDVVVDPGWQPMHNDEDTLAENLVGTGYYTGFVTDTLPNFAPGMNFTRGFYQWEFVRGQQNDRWRSPATVESKDLEKYGDAEEIRKSFATSYLDNIVVRHVANTAYINSEEDTTTAGVFRWAMDFIEDNRKLQPFYLMVDSFKPHEPWDAPDAYREMYANPKYNGRTIIHTQYCPADEEMSEAELENVIANYYGLVTLVDTWFGYFINKLKRLNLWDNSLVILLSDHGTNLADNPERITGKPNFALYPGVMHVPLLVHFPHGKGQGQRFNQLVYNLEVPATLYHYAGIDVDRQVKIDGQSLHSLIQGTGWKRREYLTCRFTNTLWYRDDRFWVFSDINGKPRAVFDLQKDPTCQNNIASHSQDVAQKAWKRILHDAGGNLPVYPNIKQTDALGRDITHLSK